ncbi:hypothetical protein TRFO_00898 [Tritrichomonas foetus]|uniref:Uncharacterized protein n=1 Tax=Tritrichomonas foetus TaxID=1144522 RepID=A0A1J4L6Q1_9EUKA|nr:hypothetical protein TRFO_00898 [Tritrichomonas foetus]|eukprot:OHT17629.1 hypothetical protein TRFO_00898 [Tritrichomonas foetus]
MIVFYLLLLTSAEQKHLNLTTYVKGLWNCSVYYMDEEGDFYGEEKDFFEITFEKEKYTLLRGVTKGLSSEREITVKIDSENQQHFTIENRMVDAAYSESQTVGSATMLYYKRNMPIARGEWMNETQHFKILIFSPINFELTVYRPDSHVLEIYRFRKTPVPEMSDALRVMAPPLVVGVFFIAYKLYEVHEYIEDQEKAKILANKGKSESDQSRTGKEEAKLAETENKKNK